MPTFTTIALENLLEPRVLDSLKKPDPENPSPESGCPRHLYISPALYATPEQAPIPENSEIDPLSPSPYLVNHKRRRGGNERRAEVPELPCGNRKDGFVLEEVGENFVNENDDTGEEDEGFLDPRSEAMRIGSEVDVIENDLGRNQLENRSFVSVQGEFFDAIDEFSDGSTSNIPSFESRLETELHALRLSLLEEIERRKAAEETFILMHIQWEKIGNLMFDAGFTFPAPPPASDSMQLENHVLDQLSQEVLVARFVAEAVGKGKARAEAEEAASAVVELKDREIMRLRDRLQYYETVNHEMSQRKIVEVARKQQDRKRSRRRWLWSFVGLSIAIGASLTAYAYIPHTSECMSLLKSGDSSDASSVSCSETTPNKRY